MFYSACIRRLRKVISSRCAIRGCARERERSGDILGRYAGQRSTALVELSKSPVSSMQPPYLRFGSSAPALTQAATLPHWRAKVGPGGRTYRFPTHPPRYLVRWPQASAECTVDRVRPKWTWHDCVRLVAGQNATDTYHVVKDVRDDHWKMEVIYWVLPKL